MGRLPLTLRDVFRVSPELRSVQAREMNPCGRMICALLCLAFVSCHAGMTDREIYDERQEKMLGLWCQDVSGKELPVTLRFMPNGTFEADFNADTRPELWGNFHLENSELRLNYTVAEGCLGTLGTYTYSFLAGRLWLRRERDDCESRAAILNGVWRR